MTDTDQYLRDLEEAAAAVGSLPADYAALRDLLAQLPRPTQPDVRPAGTGVPAEAAGAGGLSAAGLTIQSPVPIGSESGIGQGIVQQQMIGLRNLLIDARQSGVSFSELTLTSSYQRVGYEWRAKYDAGATGSVGKVFKSDDFSDPALNPFQTAIVQLNVDAWTAAGTSVLTHSLDELGSQAFSFDPTVLPYAVFSCMIYKNVGWDQQFTNVTSCLVQLIIRNDADDTTLAVSTPFDFKNLALGGYARVWVAVDSAELDFAEGARPRIIVTTVTSGTGSADEFHVGIANPQLELTPYQVPTLFAPNPKSGQVEAIVGGNSGLGVIVHGDTDTFLSNRGRVGLGLSPSGEGTLEFGSGTATDDIRLRRSAAKVLTLDDNTSAPASMVVDLEGQLRIRGIISPAQITANTDDYNPTDLHISGVLRITSDAARNLTGINAGSSGEMILLVNRGSFTITLVHDATSTAANRFLCPGSANYSLTTNSSVFIWYDITSARWRVVG